MNMDNTRFVLITALLLLLFLLYQEWQKDYGIKPISSNKQNTEISQGVTSATGKDLPRIPEEGKQEPGESVTLPREGHEQGDGIVLVETDSFSMKIDLQGAIVVYAGLKQYPVSLEESENPLALMDRSPALTHYVQDGLLSSGPAPSHETAYQASARTFVLPEGENTLEVPFFWVAADGSLAVTKTYRFQRGSHVVAIWYEIENRGPLPWSGNLYSQIKRNDPGRTSRLGIYTYTGAVFSSPENRYVKIDFDDMREKKSEQKTRGGWVAMIQHYFLTALIPAKEDDEYQFYANSLNDGNFAAGMFSPSLTLAAGEKGTLGNRLYIGPKIQESLSETAEGLDLTVDYGKLWVLSKPLFIGLNFLHDLTGNWGWSIILVTVILKMVFFPLSAAGFRSMANMRRVQPRLIALKERYQNDKTQLNQAMMQIYKEEKINPFGGCFPILIQIPVFLALYWVLVESVEMRQAPFIFWLNDLSTKDPYFILPLLMGVTMFVQQKLNPPPMDPVQAKVMSILPVIFTGFFAFFPSGLVLYWVVNSVLSIAQQWQITHSLERAGHVPVNK